MTFFTSEYDTKLDAKGRLALPARIKAQLPALPAGGPELEAQELVIRRGFEPCLMLYPMVEFKKVFSKISGLSEFNEEYRKLQRNFLSGVVTVELDGNGRILIPKNMLSYAQLDKDVLLVGLGTKVEVWNRDLYEKHIIKESSELSKLAEKHLMDS
jgi:MraZ protein